MPWKEGLVEKYGDSFKPWTEEDLLQALQVIAALPHNQLATIVSLVSLDVILFRCIIPLSSEILSIKCCA